VPIVLKSGSLNFLEPSGPVKACNGIAYDMGLIEISFFILLIPSQFIVFLTTKLRGKN
jgi:hypothetical protein